MWLPLLPIVPTMSHSLSRLAPSPTGALHLGNIRTFLVNWALARRRGWTLRARIEDLDGPRIKPDAATQVLENLTWLGIEWDGDVLYQSEDLDCYRSAMRLLADRGYVHACSLTRSEIEVATSAPHEEDTEVRCPPALRPRDATTGMFDDEQTNYRFRVEEGEILVQDTIRGTTTCNPFRECGDFIVWTRRGMPAYQLAVVVDDARTGVTDVVRGDDLLPSAARQHLLYLALGYPLPRWWHLPLVRGPDGRRLAKRHGDTRIQTYIERGVPAERIVGLIASWSGLPGPRRPMTAGDFRDQFDLDTLPLQDIVFMEEDHQWLLRR